MERAQGLGRSGFLAAASGKALAAGGAAYGAAAALKRNAEVELAVTRIGVNADVSDEKIGQMQTGLRDLAFQAGKSFNEVTEGLADLVAGGAELPDALKSLPAIVKTAQASGAEVKDMAATTMALNQALGIAPERMQAAFDAMVEGGKQGKFELKDMARYFASIAPQAATLGLKGEAGLQRIVALLQTIRAGTGTAEEAATGFRDVMSRLETDETFNKFKKFGVDIRKEMAAARKAGKDPFDTLIEATKKATKGDMSKLPQLFGEKDSRQAILALMTYDELLTKVTEKLKTSAGAAERDFKRISETQQIMINKFSESIDRVQSAGGAFLGKYAAGDINAISQSIEKAFSDGLYAGVSDFVSKIQPGGEGDLVGQFTTSVLKAMGITPKPMFTPEKTEQARQEVEDGRAKVLKERVVVEELKERARKAGLGEVPAPLNERIRDNPVIADAREGLFSFRQHSPVPFSKQTGGEMSGFGRKTADDYFASLPKAPPRWIESARELANQKDNGRLPAPTQDMLAALNAGLEGIALKFGTSKDTTVTAEVTGEAQLQNNVNVEVTVNDAVLTAKVRSITREQLARIPLRSNGPGSTGISSPDARPSAGIGEE